MSYKYTTRDAVLDAINEERFVKADDVAPNILRAKVWCYGGGFPGCLYESGPHYAATKADAISGLIEMIEWELDADAQLEESEHSDADCERILKDARESFAEYGAYGYGNWIYELSENTIGGVL